MFFRFQTQYVSRVLHIAKDLGFLYQNFLHWNVSKLFIALSSFILGIALALPFLLITLGLMFADEISWKTLFLQAIASKPIGLELISSFLTSPGFVIFEGILLVCAIISFVIGYSYGTYLKSKLYYGYHLRQKIPVLGNTYFSIVHIKKFVHIFLWNFLYIIFPFLLFICLSTILYFLKNFELISFNLFSNILLCFFILCLILFSYLIFRVSFSYIEYAQTSDISRPAKTYIQLSLQKTRGFMIVNFLGVFFLLGLVLFPFTFVETKIQDQEIFITDHIRFLETSKDLIPQDEQLYQEYLQNKYKNISQDTLIKIKRKWNWIDFGYSLFLILCIEGLSFQIFVSYYLLFSRNADKSLFSKWFKGKF